MCVLTNENSNKKPYTMATVSMCEMCEYQSLQMNDIAVFSAVVSF